MTIQHMTIEIGGKQLYVHYNEDNNRVLLSFNGQLTLFLEEDVDEDDRWAAAHRIYELAYGHKCTCGDVRSLQMMLGLICS